MRLLLTSLLAIASARAQCSLTTISPSDTAASGPMVLNANFTALSNCKPGWPGAGVPTSTGSAWGSSYVVGTGANNLVQLNGSAQLPAVSAFLLTNFPTLNQNTTGTAANVTGVVAESNGGTGAANTPGAAGHFLRSNGAHYVDASIQAGDVPTLNQNTTGNAATATALAATPTKCSAGFHPLGVDSAGNAVNCTADPVGGSGQIDYPVSYQTHFIPLGFSLTSVATVANTSTATSVVGSNFAGRASIPAGAMLPNTNGTKTIRIHAVGAISTASSAPTLTFTILLGGQTLGTITAPVVGSLSVAGYELDYEFTVTGLTTAMGGGSVCGNIGTAGAHVCGYASSGSITGLNFATQQVLDVQATWSTANASNVLTANVLTARPIQGI